MVMLGEDEIKVVDGRPLTPPISAIRVIYSGRIAWTAIIAVVLEWHRKGGAGDSLTAIINPGIKWPVGFRLLRWFWGQLGFWEDSVPRIVGREILAFGGRVMLISCGVQEVAILGLRL